MSQLFNNTVDFKSTQPASASLDAPVRPKAFRRPSNWQTSPDNAEIITDDTQKTSAISLQNSFPSAHMLARQSPAAPSTKRSASDKHYGIILIAILMGTNLLLGLILSNNTNVSDSNNRATTPNSINAPSAPSRNDITVFSTPVDVRRTATYLTLESTADSTDTMIMPMPPAPDASNLE